MTETKVNSPCKTCRNKKKRKPDKIQDPTKHWIKFKIVDVESKPLENVVLQITLPDGCSSEEITTNKDGIAEIKNIEESGTCKLEYNLKRHTIKNVFVIR
jgi:hypothetical protein